MSTPHHATNSSKTKHRAGLLLSGLVTLFLAFDGVSKVLQFAPVVKASEELRLPTHSIVPIGVVLLFCTLLYTIPRTAFVGTLLLTGYLGGAIATHVGAQTGTFPIVFSLGVAVLTWLGLILRRPHLQSLILSRS